MGGPNLEVFKFGMYIMFPIGIMYYFGVNLDEKFSVPDFWPKKDQTHTIPFDKDEIRQELEVLKQRRLAARQRRLETEALLSKGINVSDQHAEINTSSGQAPTTSSRELDARENLPLSTKGSWMSWLR